MLGGSSNFTIWGLPGSIFLRERARPSRICGGPGMELCVWEIRLRMYGRCTYQVRGMDVIRDWSLLAFVCMQVRPSELRNVGHFSDLEVRGLGGEVTWVGMTCV